MMASDLHAKRKTQAGRVRPLPIVMALAIVLIGFIVATQHVASALEYQSALGEPLLTFGSVQLYPPFGWITWFMQFRQLDHPVLDAAFGTAARFVAAGFAIAAVVAILGRYFSTRDLQEETPSLHGTAHWMTREKVLGSGLVNAGRGVYVGAWKDGRKNEVHYLRHDGPEHVMALAPTRSGKGVGLVLPTLLGGWPHSVVVHDMKGEAWAITSGWRQREGGNYVLRFDPADPSGSAVRFNPLEEVRVGTEKEVGDVQNLVTMIVDPDGKGLNDHWAKTGHALLVGAVLHVLYAERNRTLCGVAEFLSDPSRPFEEALNAMLETEHDTDGRNGWYTSDGQPTRVHPVVASSARDMLNKADNERSGVLSTAMSFLTLYRDPIVANNTRASEFRISDLMNAERPVSLYLVVRPSDKDRLKPLIRLMMNQIVRGLTEHMEFEGGRSVANYKHRLLLLIDEFPALGKLEIFEEALAFVGGYGIKCYLIIQDKSQLEKHYGKEESITSNCHIRIAYAPNKIETAEMLSKLVGTTTIVKQSTSYSGGRNKSAMNNISTQVQEVSRPLLTPDEIMRLRAPTKDAAGNITDAGDMLIFQAGTEPIYGTQILYFLDPTFAQRSKIAPPAMSDRVRAPAAAAHPSPHPAISTLAPEPAVPREESPTAGATDEYADDDYEHPPLPESAMVRDDEYAEPEASVLVDDGDPELGSELTATREELDALPPEEDQEDDSDDDASAPHLFGGGPIAAPATHLSSTSDPFLAASVAWAAGKSFDPPAAAAAADDFADPEADEMPPPVDNPMGDFAVMLEMTSDGRP